MYCSNCGSEIKNKNDRFCELCGTPITPEIKPEQSIPPKIEELNHLQDEVSTLRQEANQLRNQARRNTQLHQNQQTCCGCVIAMIMIGIFFSVFFSVFMYSDWFF